MDDDKEKLNEVEDLKKKLFSTSYKTRIEDREGFHYIHREKIPETWNESDLNNNKNTVKKNPIFQNFFIFSFIVFLGAVGYLLFNFFIKGNDVSNENIEIAVFGNTFTGGGEELPLIVEITNKNSLPLELADLVIEYPKGSAVDNTGEEIARLRKSLGIVKAGEVKSETVKVSLFGETGSIHQIKIALEYRLEGSNAIFLKEKAYEVTINSTPVNLSIDAPVDAIPDQEFILNVKATLNETKEVPNNLTLKLDYPFGFEFISSNPSPEVGNNIWNLTSLKPGEEFNVEIKGRMVDVFEGEEKIFHALAGPLKTNDKSELGVVFNSFRHGLFIKKPFVETKLFVNSEYKKEYAVSTKSAIIGVIEWTNNLKTSVNDLQIKAKLSGNAYNPRNVKVESGFFDSKINTIIWDKNIDEVFTEIAPGKTGNIFFTLSPTSVFGINGNLLVDPAINIEIAVLGKQTESGSALKNLDIVENKTIKLISDLSLLSKSSYAGSPFKNTGPYPPAPEKETTYTITFSVANTTNNISKAKLVTTLPPRVSYKNLISPKDEKLTFDPATRELIWDIGTIARETGLSGPKKEVSFQVSYTPSLSEIGLIPTLVNKSTLTGHDDFANVDLRVERPIIQSGESIKE